MVRNYSSSCTITDNSIFAFDFVVRDRARNGFYAAVLGGTLCIFGGVGYLLGKELFGGGATYPLIDEAVALIEQDKQLIKALGPAPLSIFGTSDGRRRRPAVRKDLSADGRQLVEAQFYVKGDQGRGKVHLRVAEQEDGQWEKQFLTVELPGHPPYFLIKSRPANNSIGGWNPFSRLFNGRDK